jgi:hypothetical protein
VLGPALVVLLGLLLLYVLGRHETEGLVGTWDSILLTPGGAVAVERMREKVSTERELADIVLELARHSEATEARRLLRAGCDVIESGVLERRKMLDGLATYSRMARAIAPTEPIRVDRFTRAPDRAAAVMASGVHHALISRGARFRMRIHLLRYVLEDVLGAIREVRDRVDREALERLTRDLGAARQDLAAVEDEALLSLGVLLKALAVEDGVEQTS